MTGPPDGQLLALLELPGVAQAVTDAREAVDRLRRHRLLRQRTAQVSVESALHAARASADLEGEPVPLAELRRALAGGTGLRDRPVVAAAVRLYAGLGELTGAWERAPRQVLARLHVLAAAGSVAPDGLARPRPQAVPRLGQLAGLIASREPVPAVLLSAVVHGELLALRPFGTGDGLVARAAARLVLITRGLDPSGLAVPEVGHLELREAYVGTAAAYAGARAEGDLGPVADWLVHCAQAVELGAQEGLAVCEAMLRSGGAHVNGAPDGSAVH